MLRWLTLLFAIATAEFADNKSEISRLQAFKEEARKTIETIAGERKNDVAVQDRIAEIEKKIDTTIAEVESQAIAAGKESLQQMVSKASYVKGQRYDPNLVQEPKEFITSRDELPKGTLSQVDTCRKEAKDVFKKIAGDKWETEAVQKRINELDEQLGKIIDNIYNQSKEAGAQMITNLAHPDKAWPHTGTYHDGDKTNDVPGDGVDESWGAGGANFEACTFAGCPEGWAGDGTCDQDCNIPECNFDRGDCGESNSERKENG